MKNSASDAHVQHKILKISILTIQLIIDTPCEEHDVKRQRLTYMFNIKNIYSFATNEPNRTTEYNHKFHVFLFTSTQYVID